MKVNEDRELAESRMKKAETLFQEGFVRHISFSGGTYQMEVQDTESYWIFLQTDDEGKLQDSLCTCEEAEREKKCAHLSAGMLAIFGKEKDPIHVRFQSSFWNALFQVLGKRCGYGTDVLQKNEDTYQVSDAFVMHLKSNDAKAKAIECIDERREETEETSIKFSNLSVEELDAWQRGKPSESLQYELSFWSDLAKWLFLLEDEGKEIQIVFEDQKGELPKKVEISLEGLALEIQIVEKDWPLLIPALSLYDTNLKVFDFQDVVIKQITYDRENQHFNIDSEPIPEKEKKAPQIVWDKWIFRKGVGFFARQEEPLLAAKTIPKEKMGYFLHKYGRLIEKYLVGEKIARKPRRALYTLSFDPKGDLHISTYVFEPFDFTLPHTVFFDPWVYIEGKGFYRLYQTLFKGIEKVISKEMMPEFIEHNRHWLNKFEEFRIHLSSIETKMTYEMDGDVLKIHADQTLFDETGEIIDFGSWLYVKGQGFFSRGKGTSHKAPLFPSQVFKENLSSFIHDHHDDLEQIRGFFTQESGLERTGLVVQLDEKEQIVIKPHYVFKDWAQDKGARVYGDFIYIPTKGFAEIPDNRKILPTYWKEVVIDKDHVPYFIKHELKRIKPYLLELDKKLVEPTRLKLCVKHARAGDKGWWIVFTLNSNLGEVPLIDVRASLLKFHPVMLSEAGMISLKEKRFGWLIRTLATSVNVERKEIFISTLDWIRLSLFDQAYLPETSDPEEQKVMQTLASLQGEHMMALPMLKGLKSVLRPYQEMGVRWLWFLYTYGLSGFLCDEMGLGKTHQAMALIAAVMNEKKKSSRSKFLVVCPTSVIYHWQGLLEKFLKKANVVVYHGSFREPRELKVRCDIIVTTYGILRSDKELFKKMHFEVAIFDELQVAKNQKSQIHSTLKQISAEMKLGITGTPIENSLSELKALFDIVLPQFLPTAQEFKEEFVIPIEKGGDVEKQKALSLLIKPFILRRKKQEVLQDLPEKIEEVCYVDLSDEQRRLYESAVLGSKDLLNEEGGTFYMHVFALLTKLKQICNHPALAYKDPKNFHRYESGKWDLFLNLLEETMASGQKLVVFSQYLEMLDIIEMHLKEMHIEFAGIRGSTVNRREEVRRFQEEESCRVFVGSLQAAGVGIDLTAASVVIHYDRWWNPAKENQATDRVHRMGQNRGVSVFKLVVKNSVEEHIDEIIQKKMNLVKNIVGYDNESEFKKLDRSELEKLMKQLYADIL